MFSVEIHTYIRACVLTVPKAPGKGCVRVPKRAADIYERREDPLESDIGVKMELLKQAMDAGVPMNQDAVSHSSCSFGLNSATTTLSKAYPFSG